MNPFTRKLILMLSFCLIIASSQAQWISLASGTTKNLFEIQFINQNTGYVVGEKATVLKTVDAGNNWIPRNPTINSDLHELYFLDENLGWVVGDSGKVCKTIDGANTWQVITLPNSIDLHLHSVFALNQNIVFVGGSNATQNSYLFKSTDGGNTWQSCNVETYIWSIDILKIGMINATTGYALTRGNALKTIDGGQNWFITDTSSVRTGKMFSVLEDMAFFPNNDTVHVCGWYPAYFGSSINASIKWNHQYDYDYYNLDFINPRIGYVGGWGYMHKTVDGGVTFTDASGGNTALFSGIYSIDFIDENTGYACGEKGKIIRTTTGGSTGIDAEEKTVLNFYPNPSKEYIQFNTYSDVTIYNNYGQLVLLEQNTNHVDIRMLSPGIYSLKISEVNNNKIGYHKIIIN